MGKYYYSKWQIILSYIFKNHDCDMTTIRKRADISYSSATNLVNLLVDMKFITRKKIGRKSIISITSTGKFYGKRISEMLENDFQNVPIYQVS